MKNRDRAQMPPEIKGLIKMGAGVLCGATAIGAMSIREAYLAGTISSGMYLLGVLTMGAGLTTAGLAAKMSPKNKSIVKLSAIALCGAVRIGVISPVYNAILTGTVLAGAGMLLTGLVEVSKYLVNDEAEEEVKMAGIRNIEKEH